MNFENVPEFDKEFKKLTKKYRTLPKDFETFKEALAVAPSTLNGAEKVAGLGNNIIGEAFIAKKFFCECLNKGNRSGIRITYNYLKMENKIKFIEIFHKNQKDIEDKNRILKYCGVK